MHAYALHSRFCQLPLELRSKHSRCAFSDKSCLNTIKSAWLLGKIRARLHFSTSGSRGAFFPPSSTFHHLKGFHTFLTLFNGIFPHIHFGRGNYLAHEPAAFLCILRDITTKSRSDTAAESLVRHQRDDRGAVYVNRIVKALSKINPEGDGLRSFFAEVIAEASMSDTYTRSKYFADEDKRTPEPAPIS